MRRVIGLTLAVTLCAAIGCDGYGNPKADAVRSETQQDAEMIRESHDANADLLRDSAGKDWTGAAQNPNVERAADGLENAGEQAADTVESLGEKKADRIESTTP